MTAQGAGGQGLVKPAILEDRQPIPDSLARYMSLGKFGALLLQKKLHLARIDGFRGDPLEGDVDTGLLKIVSIFLLEREKGNGSFDGMSDEAKSAFLVRNWMYARELACKTFASCWFEATSEDFQMWQDYGGNAESVCLFSNCEALLRLSHEQPHATSPVIARVCYDGLRGDFASLAKLHFRGERLSSRDTELPDPEPQPTINLYAYLKRSYFQRERELRVSVVSLEDDASFALDVEPASLIKRVVLHPAAPPYMEAVVQDLVVAAGLPKELVEHSALRGR